LQRHFFLRFRYRTWLTQSPATAAADLTLVERPAAVEHLTLVAEVADHAAVEHPTLVADHAAACTSRHRTVDRAWVRHDPLRLRTSASRISLDFPELHGRPSAAQR